MNVRNEFYFIMIFWEKHMFQVVVQSAIRQLKSKFKLPPPPSSDKSKEDPEEKDQTVFILMVFLVASVFLLIVFGNILK